MKFNGIKKDWLKLERGRTKAPFAPITRTLIGKYLSKTETEPLLIMQPVFFFFENNEHKLSLEDELADWLYTEEPVSLEFSDEPGRIYYAVVQNTINDFRQVARSKSGTIEFLVLDGYGYGQEKKNHLPTTQSLSTIKAQQQLNRLSN